MGSRRTGVIGARCSAPPAGPSMGQSGRISASEREPASVAEIVRRLYMKGAWVSLAHGDSLCICDRCMDLPRVASPVPARVSVDRSGDRHAEPRHSVEHIAPDFCFGLLIGQSSGLKSPADNGLVAKLLCFNQNSDSCNRTDVASPSARASQSLPDVGRAVLLWFHLQPKSPAVE